MQFCSYYCQYELHYKLTNMHYGQRMWLKQKNNKKPSCNTLSTHAMQLHFILYSSPNMSEYISFISSVSQASKVPTFIRTIDTRIVYT